MLASKSPIMIIVRERFLLSNKRISEETYKPAMKYSLDLF